jgi:hypothetical protein
LPVARIATLGERQAESNLPFSSADKRNGAVLFGKTGTVLAEPATNMADRAAD